jgi:hypothetical protein
MQTAVAIIGLLITAMGLTGFIHPPSLLRLARAIWQSPRGIYVVVTLRVILGLTLITAAPACRFPTAVRSLGILALIAAAYVIFLGTSRIRKLLEWWAARPTPLIRAWLLIPTTLGCFLIYTTF